MHTEKQNYGWLSPIGEFIPSPWNKHEEYAEKICEENRWDQEFWEWFDEEHSVVCITSRLMRDFLVHKKGYCLIHDPTGVGYIVTHQKPLTKKQREFLYDYFVAAGDKIRAREYLEH